MPDLRKDIRELARALKDEWRAERLEWIDRTLRMLLFLNAGGAALTATYIVAVIQTESLEKNRFAADGLWCGCEAAWVGLAAG